MDCNIQRRGIPLASKCVCCATPKTKTLEHLLVQSDIAKNLWSHFAHKLHKKMNFRSFHHLCRLWLQGGHRQAQLGIQSWLFCSVELGRFGKPVVG